MQQLKQDVEKEANNYKHQDNLQLCQVSHKCFYSVEYTRLFIKPFFKPPPPYKPAVLTFMFTVDVLNTSN